jgi:hypothetical protein
MDSTIWFSGVVISFVVLAIILGDRQSKLARRIDALDRKLRLLPDYKNLEGSLSEWQKLALDPSSKIDAIKAYRAATGVGLAEAKDAVERWLKER